MSEVSFKDPQATLAQSADANGSQGQQGGQQAPQDDQGARLKELEQKFAVTQKRVDDSQAYIQQLKTERDAALEQAAKARKIEDVYSALKEEPQQRQPVEGQPAPFDSEELLSKAEARVMARLKAESAAQTEDANFKYVASELTKKYGDTVDSMVKEVAEESGLSMDEVALMARQKPKAFLRMFHVEAKQVQQMTRPTSSSFNASAAKANKQSTALPAFRLGNFQEMKAYADAAARNIVNSKE